MLIKHKSSHTLPVPRLKGSLWPWDKGPPQPTPPVMIWASRCAPVLFHFLLQIWGTTSRSQNQPLVPVTSGPLHASLLRRGDALLPLVSHLADPCLSLGVSSVVTFSRTFSLTLRDEGSATCPRCHAGSVLGTSHWMVIPVYFWALRPLGVKLCEDGAV